jgi:hypothetical protein
MSSTVSPAAADLSEPPIANGGDELRARLGKLLGMIGSAHAGERENALSAVDQALARAGMTWATIGRLVSRGGELPNDREALFARVMKTVCRDTIPRAWALNGGEAKLVSAVFDACDGSRFAELDAIDLRKVVEISERARKRAR